MAAVPNPTPVDPKAPPPQQEETQAGATEEEVSPEEQARLEQAARQQVAALDDTGKLPAIDMDMTNMPISQRLWFDQGLFERAKTIAGFMSKATGMVPPHLIGNPAACFFVIEKALTWNLAPSAVAASTFVVPGSGKVGYEGKLCQAILENSGHLIGGIEYEYFGDWTQVEGKFTIKAGAAKADGRGGKEYAHRDWSRNDALKGGCGVYVIAVVRGRRKGEAAKRHKWPFHLERAFPLNSTLWATDPKTQICYAAVRRFGSAVVPGIFMGLPFGRDDMDDGDIIEGDTSAPPQPQRTDFQETDEDKGPAQTTGEPEDEGFALIDNDGVVMWAGGVEREFANVFIARMTSVLSPQMVEGLWDTNSSQLSRLPKELADEVRKAHADALNHFGWKAQS